MDPRERLRSLSVASPCTASWSQMRGDDAIRHCATCAQSVYNLEKLTSEQVVALLDSGERVCGRFFRRADGTVVTGDCAWAWADATRRARGLLGAGGWKRAGAVASVLVLLVAVGLVAVTLFGDSLRRLLGASTTGTLVEPPVAKARLPAGRTPEPGLRSFGEECE